MVQSISRSVILLLVLSVPTLSGAQEQAVGDPNSAQELPSEYLQKKAERAKKIKRVQPPEKLTHTVYDRMTYKGLTASIPNHPGRRNEYLRITRPDAFRYSRGRMPLNDGGRHRGNFTLPPELLGQPGLVTRFNWFFPYQLHVEVDRPARVYAYIWWDATPMPNPERELWHVYSRDPNEDFSLYYRELDKGKHTLKFDRAPFIGVGLCPLDGLSEKERIVVADTRVDGKPHLRIDSRLNGPVHVQWQYRAIDQDTGKPTFRGQKTITVKPGEQLVPVDVDQAVEGVMYFIEHTLTRDKTTWNRTQAWGHFPPPGPDASTREPIIPFGGYIKLEVNNDRHVYDHFLAATFYHFRKMGMNACVLGAETPSQLDTARRYDIRCVVRLGNKGGKIRPHPKTMMDHPAILTYMIGDEPKIGTLLDNHVELYKTLNTMYPRFLPISCTIYDSYGTGDTSDPCLIHNLYMKDLEFIRFGRYYCFRKDNYGLLWPAEYKGMLPVVDVLQGLEANGDRPWWIAPPFFGKKLRLYGPTPYWRIPTGRELKGLMHLAMAHRCTGILGWGTHSHGNVTGSFFDGHTMGKTRYFAGEEVGRFGRQLMKGKSVIQAFSPRRLQLFWRQPAEIDATARWLTDGRVAVYVVNRDVDNAHPAEVHVYLGGVKAMKPRPDGDAWFNEIAEVRDVFTDRVVPFERLTRKVPGVDNHLVLLKLKLGKLAPADAALLVVKAKTDDGAFTQVPEDVKQGAVDFRFRAVDF